MHFVVVYCNMQIKGKVKNICIPIPRDCMPVMMDVYEFVAAMSTFPSGAIHIVQSPDNVEPVPWTKKIT